jgi:hypothetical protein
MTHHVGCSAAGNDVDIATTKGRDCGPAYRQARSYV